MFRRYGNTSKAFITGTALPWASSAIVSAVNPRFFRFKRPLQLAILVGVFTFIFTAGVGCAVYFLGCRTAQINIPLNQITNSSASGRLKDTCREENLKNFFISSRVDESYGAFGTLSSLFPEYINANVYQWNADTLYALANVSANSPIDLALSNMQPVQGIETKLSAAYYSLPMTVPEIPGSKSTGQKLNWAFQMFESTTLNGTRKNPPEDCPKQWKFMLQSPPIPVTIQGQELFVRFNNTLDWTCTGYTWLFAEVAGKIQDPLFTNGTLRVGENGVPQLASLAVQNDLATEANAVQLELEEAVTGSWFAPIQWCTELYDSTGQTDSWCGTLTYSGLIQEIQRHLRKVSSYYAMVSTMDEQARTALQEWTGTLKEVSNGNGFILGDKEDFRKIRSSIILFMSHMSTLVSLMSSSQFKREFESSLQLNTVACRPRVCPAILGTIGSALGYMSLLEVGAAFFILAIYLLRYKDEQVKMQELSEIVFESVPEAVIQAAYQAYDTQTEGPPGGREPNGASSRK